MPHGDSHPERVSCQTVSRKLVGALRVALKTNATLSCLCHASSKTKEDILAPRTAPEMGSVYHPLLVGTHNTDTYVRTPFSGTAYTR